MWTRATFSEATALEPNWDIVGFRASTKDGLITAYRFMEKVERFSFRGDIFIPVAKERGRH